MTIITMLPQNIMKKGLNQHIPEPQMRSILDHSVSEELRITYKTHINGCQNCWNQWNKVRWDRARHSHGLKELQQYLGDSFSTYYDSSWALANEWNLQLRLTKTDVEAFYQKTSNYLYNQIVFFESGDRTDFKPLFQQLDQILKLKVVLDYGCGVGNDTLSLIEAGFRVLCVDFDSPSLEFLRWRLGRRGISKEQCRVISLEKLQNHRGELSQIDMFWGIDVLEHMFDPYEVFNIIPDDIKAFAYYVDSDDKAGGRHPFHFTFPTAEFHERLLLRKLRLFTNHQTPVTVWTR